MFRYTVTPDPHAHLLRVSLELTPPQDAVTLHMPSWTSGSYLIRDYAGRIRGPRSNTGTLVQTDKCHWTVSGLTPGATLRIEWEAFTYSVGIHDAWLDDIRGFYNPAAVLLIPEGIDAPCLLDFSDCRFVPHCSLEPIGTHSFAASCTQELLDAPVTFTSAKGEHCILNLSVCGIPHTLVFTGPGSSTLNKDLILQDAQAILKTVLDFWGAPPSVSICFTSKSVPVSMAVWNTKPPACFRQTHWPFPAPANPPVRKTMRTSSLSSLTNTSMPGW